MEVLTLGKFFYSKLALSNLRRNKNAYVPYILACIGIVFTYFLFCLIGRNDGMKNLNGRDALAMIFSFGEVVVGIFSVIFILYANSFLMKRRKKEIGLYGILGLEKRHVSYVMFYETLFMGFFSISIGLIFGVVFGKLVFLGLMKILNTAGDSTFQLSISAFIKTIVFFSIIFGATLVLNYISVHVTNPIALLKGEEQGEKEPKTKIITAILGLILLGIGYYMALTVNSSIAAINEFFIAVLFVIGGTYFIFTAGSIALLKILKRNKNFYYKPKNFISISSMIYRMKQNAAGLATICILSTMVLVTASTTIALYAGEEEILRVMSPFDITVTAESKEIDEDFLNQVKGKAKEHNVTVTSQTVFSYKESGGMLKENVYDEMDREKYSMEDLENYSCTITYITIDEYNKIANLSKTLNKNEIILVNPSYDYKYDNLTIGDVNLAIKERNIFDGLVMNTQGYYKSMYVVLNKEDFTNVEKELLKIDSKNYDNIEKSSIYQNLKGNEKNRIKYAEDLENLVKNFEGSKDVDSIDINRGQSFQIYGGLLFIGVFLSLLFLLATVLIIYFKQVSEGFNDRKRFIILRKVGMDEKSIKQTINKQIIMVFFLPLIGAIVHIAFAFKMICSMLKMFYLTNTDLFLQCTVGVIVIFSVIYATVYLTTAKVYFKVVNEENM